MRIRLTERDWTLLLALYSRTLMSFRQIWESHFAGKSKAVVHNRLTELEKAALLRRMRVGRILHHLEGKELGVVFQTSRTALKLLPLKFPERSFRGEVVPINTSTLYHDLLVGDVLQKLEKRFQGTEFVDGKLVASDFLHGGRLPDGIAYWPDRNNILAVELEISCKSEKRYRHIISQYRMQEQFTAVLYVTSNRTTREKIETLLTHKKVHGLEQPSTGKFYFVDLQELLNNPLTAKITNSREELKNSRKELNNGFRIEMA